MISRFILIMATTGCAICSSVCIAQQDMPERGTTEKTAVSVEEHIYRTLSVKTKFDFHNAPLTDLVEFIRDTHDVNAQLDVAGMDLVDVSPDDEISIAVAGVSLRSALKMTLRQRNLTFVVRDEVLQITSVETAMDNPFMIVHDVSDIVAQYAGNDAEESFPAMIRKLVSPQSWANSGHDEQCTVVLMSFTNERHFLFVKQIDDNHLAVEDLIDQLRKRIE